MKRLFSILLAIITATPTITATAYTESRAYLFAGSTAIYIHNVNRTNGSINLVCPDYYEIDANGDLMLTRPVDPVFLSDMRQKGIKALPSINNHWDRPKARKALAKYETFADQIVEQIKRHDLDGIDIDIENIDHTDRTTYTAFIRLLREKMPKDKLLSIAVAANPWGGTIGWQGAYDYAALGSIVDIFFIMTYDESYQGGSAGPVASYKFIRDSIDFALKSVDKSKVVMGIPFYGRYWMAGAAKGGAAFTISDIEHIVNTYDSVTWYDGVNECARASVTVTREALDLGLWGSKRLIPGIYDIWYESPRSLEKKLGLVRLKDIRGAGAWALGFEPESIWKDYSTWLQPLPFKDIFGHWAQTSVINANEKGLMFGYNELFRPNDNITRAEAAVVISRLIGVLSRFAPAGFADTKGHYAEGCIATLKELGIVNGVGGDRFEPNRPITRQELCVLIERILHMPDTLDFNEAVFPDVSREKTPWSNNAIVMLNLLGIIDGYPDGTFRPTAMCSRAEAAAIVLRASAYETKTTQKEFVIEPR